MTFGGETSSSSTHCCAATGSCACFLSSRRERPRRARAPRTTCDAGHSLDTSRRAAACPPPTQTTSPPIRTADRPDAPGPVIRAAERLAFTDPTLWLNDVTYAPLIRRTDWPTVYDVTDDWLLAPFTRRELERLRALDDMAMSDAHEVVVCSAALAASRGIKRPVTLVANGVDSDHFRRPRQRPSDLPPAPTAVYLGTLHEARLDSALVVELARSNAGLSVVLVGPDSLQGATRQRLGAEANIHMLGPRPYAEVPAYLQHADVLIVPHLVTPFTESLDPIKAYECLAVTTPAVATPVAGFRELAGYISVADRDSFVEAVQVALYGARKAPTATSSPATWDARASSFETVLARATSRAQRPLGEES